MEVVEPFELQLAMDGGPMVRGMAKVRLQDPKTGRIVWVERDHVSDHEADAAPAATTTVNSQPASSPAQSNQTAKKKRGMFDDDEDVEDWTLDDL